MRRFSVIEPAEKTVNTDVPEVEGQDGKGIPVSGRLSRPFAKVTGQVAICQRLSGGRSCPKLTDIRLSDRPVRRTWDTEDQSWEGLRENDRREFRRRG